MADLKAALLNGMPEDVRPEARRRYDEALERIKQNPPPSPPEPCERCQDTGVYIDGRDGSLTACPLCDAGKAEREAMAARRFKRSGLKDYRRWTFGLTTPQSGEQTRSFEAARKWAARLSPPVLWLFGDYWTGKTRLAACIANAWYDEGRDVLFRVEPDLFDDLRNAIDDEDRHFGPEWQVILDAPYLVLDDFGKDKSTEWVEKQRFSVMNYRIQAELPTIVTTNIVQMDSAIPRLAPRVESESTTYSIPMSERYRDVGVKPEAPR